ncbi:MAG: CoA-binding protein [Proteobacteria bacterium]|nr:CoA-binding protein [Pseudomonadota bacterium]
MNPLTGFMEPRSVAFLGASGRPGSISALVLGNLLKFGFGGQIYPINPKGGELFGLKVYPGLGDVDGPVDLAVIYLPPAGVVDGIRECARKGVSSAIVVSDGLDERSDGGRTLTEEMLEAAREGGVRIMGPNSMGVINARHRFSTSFAPFEDLPEGGLSLISQTGLFTGAVMVWLADDQGVGVGKSIDLANKCDVDEIETLEYLLDDPETRVIGMHIEEVTRGSRFIDTASRVSLEKPILALKPGKTEVGSRAVSSHTGSLAGRDESYQAAFAQSGILRVQDLEELADLAKAFIHLPPMRGPRVGIVTFTGGWGALSADVCAEFGLSVAALAPETLAALQEIAPPWRRMTNPVDLWPPTRLGVADTYRACIRALAADEATDAILVLGPAFDDPMFDIYEVVREETARHPDVPLVTWAVGDRAGMNKAASMVRYGCPFFPTVRRAVRVLSALYRRHRFLESRG